MKKAILLFILFGIVSAGLTARFVVAGPDPAKPPATVVKGVVASEFGMVENARVRISGQDGFALTDAGGRFTLEAPAFSGRPLTIAAGKDGWFNNAVSVWPGSTNANIRLYAIPSGDNQDYRFISPAVCARCHNTLTKYWDQSKMAHTTSNPKVINMFNGTDATGKHIAGPGYKIDNPDQSGDCVSCHAPSAGVSKNGAGDIEQTLWSPKTEWDGISCDFCHKIRKVVKSGNTPSRYKPLLKRHTPYSGNSILVLGPYDDVVNPVMAASYSPQFDNGWYCALCHSQVKSVPKKKDWDRKTVYTDKEWEGFNIGDDSVIPVQTTFQEWKSWQDSLAADDGNKGKKCQDCHMSWRKEMLPYDHFVVDNQARNMWGVKRDPANIRPHHFDGGTQTQLATALSMEIEGEIQENVLKVNVYITNTNGGHWVPTGDPMRQVMLVLTATDSGGRELELLKGETLPSWAGTGPKERGNYSGLPGKMFSKVLKDEHNNINVPFWRAAAVEKDTRIRPKSTVSLTYTFKIKDTADEPSAEAVLIYRPFIKSLASVKKWDSKDITITSAAW